MGTDYNHYKMFGYFSRKFKVTELEPPREVKQAFARYTDGPTDMTADQLLRFLLEHQGEHWRTLDEAKEIMRQVLERRKQSVDRELSFTLDDFFHYLFQDDLNGPINPKVHHDMTAPMHHYYIYTGHNSYLTGNQLSSDCSDVPIIKALENGVRGIELDLWPNSSRDNVQVLHGRTLTTPVPLIKCFESIKEHAFVASPYPVIITLEDHLTPDLQAKVAEMAIQTFGDMLFCPESACLEAFPCPEVLEHRIILSTKPPKEYLGANNKDGENIKDGESNKDGDSKDEENNKDGESNKDEENKDGESNKEGENNKDGENIKDGESNMDGENNKAEENNKTGETNKEGEKNKAGKNNKDGKNNKAGKNHKDGKNNKAGKNNKDGETKKDRENNKGGENSSVKDYSDDEAEIDDKSDSDDESTCGSSSMRLKSVNYGAPEYKRLISIHARNAKNKSLRHVLKVEDRAIRLSMSEQEIERAASLYATKVVRFTQNNLLRVYPKGTRVDSSNFKPTTGWIHGAQMVAFNMQGYGKSLWMMHGLFRSNGGCGYVKKPDILMKRGAQDEVFDPKFPWAVKTTLKVTVYMGDGWRMDFSKTHFDKHSPPDFYTKVYICGLPQDEAKGRTRVILDDWIPRWDHEFLFPLRVPELALLRIEVREYDRSEKDDFGGQTCLLVSELRPGIRSIPLYSKKGQKYKSVRLLMGFSFE